MINLLQLRSAQRRSEERDWQMGRGDQEKVTPIDFARGFQGLNTTLPGTKSDLEISFKKSQGLLEARGFPRQALHVV